MVTRDIACILDALDGLALPREAECVCGAVVLVQPNLWIPIRDGDDRARALYLRHYSARHYRDSRRPGDVNTDGRRTERDGVTAHDCASYHKPAAPRRG